MFKLNWTNLENYHLCKKFVDNIPNLIFLKGEGGGATFCLGI